MKYILLLIIIFILWSCWTEKNDDIEKNNNVDNKKVEILESSDLWWGEGVPNDESWQR